MSLREIHVTLYVYVHMDKHMQFFRTLNKDFLLKKSAETEVRPFRQQFIHCLLKDQDISWRFWTRDHNSLQYGHILKQLLQIGVLAAK
jgi:hypothetical protein